MAFKMKSGNKPGFKNMGSSPVREHNTSHKTASFDGSADETKPTITGISDEGDAKVDIPQVNVNRAKGFENTNTRVSMHMLGGGGGVYDPISGTATNTNEDKRQSKKEQFSSDVNAFVSGVAGVPGDVIEDITSKVSAASNFVKKGIDKRKLKKEEKKQNKIDNLSAFDKKEQKKMDRENRKKAKLYEKKTKKDAKSTEENKVKKEVVVKKVVTPKKDVDKKKVVKKEVVKNTPDPKNEIKVKKQASNNYTFNNKPTPEAPKSKPYVKPKSDVRVASEKELKKLNKKPSKLSKFIKSDAAQDIGVGIATTGVTAGINALASGKKKTIRERPNIAGGFSKIKFGRKSRLTD